MSGLVLCLGCCRPALHLCSHPPCPQPSFSPQALAKARNHQEFHQLFLRLARATNECHGISFSHCGIHPRPSQRNPDLLSKHTKPHQDGRRCASLAKVGGRITRCAAKGVSTPYAMNRLCLSDEVSKVYSLIRPPFFIRPAARRNSFSSPQSGNNSVLQPCGAINHPNLQPLTAPLAPPQPYQRSHSAPRPPARRHLSVTSQYLSLAQHAKFLSQLFPYRLRIPPPIPPHPPARQEPANFATLLKKALSSPMPRSQV